MVGLLKDEDNMSNEKTGPEDFGGTDEGSHYTSQKVDTARPKNPPNCASQTHEMNDGRKLVSASELYHATPLQVLQKRIHDVNVKKGWFDEPRSFGEGVALIHSEISEATASFEQAESAHYYVNGKPEGWGIELADVGIRVIDLFTRENTIAALPAFFREGHPEYENAFVTEFKRLQQIAYRRSHVPRDPMFIKRCVRLHEITSTGLECWRDGSDWRPACALLLSELLAVFESVHLDGEALIKTKIVYNDTRPVRHGGKRI